MKIEELNLLKKKGFLKEIIYVDKLDSTNKFAKENNFESDTLIVTEYQTNGRGRLERVWNSNRSENITITLVKNFLLNPDSVHLVNFYTSYIIYLSLKKILPEYEKYRFTLKWPNDILLNNKKVSGILTELLNINTDEKKFFIGIGINVNQIIFPEEIVNKAGSLKQETGMDFSLEELISLFIENFYENISLLKDKTKLMNLWKSNTEFINKTIHFTLSDNTSITEGKIIDIQADGGIKIETIKQINTKKITVHYTGEINFIF